MNFMYKSNILFVSAAVLISFASNAAERTILSRLKPKPEKTTVFCFANEGRTSDKNIKYEAVKESLKKLSGSVKICGVNNGRIDFKFKDTSPTWWSWKGVLIKLDKALSWSDFEGITLDYKVSGKMSRIYIAFRDENGFWWDCFEGHVKSNIETTAEFEKQAFRRSLLTTKYDKRPHKKNSKLVELAVFFRVNRQNKLYSSSVKNIQIVSKFNDGRFDYTIDKNFPLQWKSTNMREDGTMLVNGKPFFPLLLFSCIGTDPSSATHKLSRYTGPTDDATLKARFKKIADAGFNTLFSYTAVFYGLDCKPGWFDGPKAKFNQDLRRKGNKRFLDFCQDAGMMGMVYLPFPDPPFFKPEKRKHILNNQKKTIYRTVNALKNHPALLLWYMWDEPCEAQKAPNDLIDTYQYAKKLDPAHPFLIAASEPRNDVYFFRAADIFAVDGYPMASYVSCTKDVDNIQTWFRPAMVNGKPFPWTIICIAHWDKPRWNRFPSVSYLRTLAFLSLVDNQKGLAFYADRNYPERAPEFWKELSKLMHSIKTLTPDILSSEKVVTEQVKVSSNKIRYILHKLTGKKYYLLLAANPQEEKARPLFIGKVNFTFPEFNIDKIEAVDEDSAGMLSLGKIRKIKLNKTGNGFSDNFWEYGTHAYRIYIK